MIINTADHINLTMFEVERKLKSFTYPVFIKASNERPDLIASSVVIQVFSRTFLITASHVINQIKIAGSPFYMAIDGSFVNLVGNFFHSISQGKKDHFDIAFIELSNEFVAKNNINILCEDRLMINRYFNSVHLSLIHGYPCSKNKQGKALKGGTTFKETLINSLSRISAPIKSMPCGLVFLEKLH